jgi:hypothetical protein
MFRASTELVRYLSPIEDTGQRRALVHRCEGGQRCHDLGTGGWLETTPCTLTVPMIQSKL